MRLTDILASTIPPLIVLVTWLCFACVAVGLVAVIKTVLY